MNNVKVLDCTLRDGGYVNNWQFGCENINKIIKKLEESNVDIVEMGFIRNQNYDINKSVYSANEQLNKFILKKKDNVIYAALIEMANYFPIEKLQERNDNGIDAIRYSFWKRKMEEAYEYASKITDKGYKLFVQPTRVEQYSDKEFAEMIETFSKLKPYAIYIVDTFGLLRKKQLLQYMKIAEEYMSEDIFLGYHAHNNMQQAFCNATEFIEKSKRKNIIVDASVYGMGRGAGNLNTEMIYDYLNTEYKGKYKIKPILEIWDDVIKDVYEEEKWGYNIPYFLAATMQLNPNYATYMLKKKDISTEQIENIFNKIQGEDKYLYSDEKAERFYQNGI